MSTASDLGSDRVAKEIYPIAVRQARDRVVLQVLVIAGFVLLGAAAGFRRDDLWFIPMLGVAMVAAIYECRWWLWVRRADPVDAYGRLQARTGREGGSARSWLTVVVSVAALGVWWFLGK